MDGSYGTFEEGFDQQVFYAAASGENLADLLPEAELAMIGQEAIRLYKLDKDSMKSWLDEMERGIELAKLSKKEKTYPFKGCANIQYPLIATAALQFNARAYPAIVPPDGAVVKCKTYGTDKDGQKAARADRVAAHMSYQLTGPIDEWESQIDRLLVQLPYVGTMVRKVWYDQVKRRACTRLIDPGRFIVNDGVSTLEEAPRSSEEFELYPHQIMTRRRSGAYRDIDYRENGGEDDQAPEQFIEYYCRMDLDRDGYEEPYIAVIHVESQKIARLVGNFRMEDAVVGPSGVVSIAPQTYFVEFHFMPSMDGGFWGTGFGQLLGGMSETVNSILNMMLDAGHMNALGGGFIGSSFRIKGGNNAFRPGEWKRVSATGADIRDGMVPMTFPGPDAVLFQLLGLLVDAGKDISGVKDVLMGDTGTRQMTATTTMALIEQGMAQFTAIYKRIYRSLRSEFKLLAKINQFTVSPDEYNAFHDEEQKYDPRQEYNMSDMDICPVSDPRSVSKMQDAAKAQLLKEMADAGLVNKGAAAQRIIEAASIPDSEELIPQPNPQEQMMMKMQMEAAQADLMQKRVDIELTLAKVQSEKAGAVKDLSDIEAAQRKQKFDELTTMLELKRDAIDTLLTGPIGRMAQQPRG